jgi:hypothetical protein
MLHVALLVRVSGSVGKVMLVRTISSLISFSLFGNKLPD